MWPVSIAELHVSRQRLCREVGVRGLRGLVVEDVSQPVSIPVRELPVVDTATSVHAILFHSAVRFAVVLILVLLLVLLGQQPHLLHVYLSD